MVFTVGNLVGWYGSGHWGEMPQAVPGGTDMRARPLGKANLEPHWRSR